MANLTSTGTATSVDTATDEPAERRMFQLTDLTGNHNKFYFVEIWPMQGGDTVRFRASWGRVGSKPQASEKVASWRELERQIDEKLRKGYRRVELHRPPVEWLEDQAGTAGPGADAKPAVRLDP